MYHPDVIARRVRDVEIARRADLPKGLPRHPIALCREMVEHLAPVYVDDAFTRPLTPEEQTFILGEQLLTALDYRYWAERYAVIAKETQDAEPITPFWASQELFMGRIAEVEQQYAERGHPDGILANVLKARQLGLSTLTQSLVAHRLTKQSSVRALTAADVKEQSQYLMGMCELIVDNLPWWLCPPKVPPTQIGESLSFATGSTLRVRWGKSSRGGYQDEEKAKGNLGRGKTIGLFHLSELSTWERPEQLNDGFFPGVPRRPRTFGVAESTAKGRYDWWHKHWLKQSPGSERFVNIFIPWYIERDKYWLPAPEGWEPKDSTKAHMELVERTSAQYLLGQTHRLSRSQAYWYEQTRATFEADDKLHQFIEEYPATDAEAFQYSGRSVFSAITLDRMRSQERTPIALVEVRPAADVAQLREWEREDAARQAAEAKAAAPVVTVEPAVS